MKHICFYAEYVYFYAYYFFNRHALLHCSRALALVR